MGQTVFPLKSVPALSQGQILKKNIARFADWQIFFARIRKFQSTACPCVSNLDTGDWFRGAH